MSDFKLPRNTLIEYKGGGYDGCIWEWNYAYVDRDGAFHDVYSSGVLGARSVEELLNRLETLRWRRRSRKRDRLQQSEDFKFYSLRTRKAAERCAAAVPYRFLQRVSAELNELGVLTLKPCDRCERFVPPDLLLTAEWAGAGGIVIVPTLLLCEDCFEEYEGDQADERDDEDVE